MARKFNFNPGPSTLPLEVLEILQKNIVEFDSAGMSILEMSHRAKEYDAIHVQTVERMKKLYSLGDNFDVIFLGGGATMQFGMVPMNFLAGGKPADYIITGTWSKKALKDAQLFGTINVAGTTEGDKFSRIPRQDELKLSSDAVYVHLTSNNTIAGTQWQEFPNTGSVPIVADMSSDILSRKIDPGKFGLIYAGAQKNLSAAGLTVVIIRKDFLELAQAKVPAYLDYKIHVKENSLYNTPPVIGIYIMWLVLDWMEKQGGLEAVEKINNRKAKLFYDAIDQNADYYRCPVEKGSRSKMNAVMRLPNEDLEKKFIAEAAAVGLHGLKGHRSVGGIRASIYNAMPLAGLERLADFMKEFKKNN